MAVDEGGSLLMQASTEDQLSDLDQYLHDAAFSLADLRFDSQRGIVDIPFYEMPKSRDLFMRKHPGRAKALADRLLTISHVANLTAEDPDGLVEHSYARLASPEPGRLTLLSNFPGRIDFEVTAIDVRLTT